MWWISRQQSGQKVRRKTMVSAYHAHHGVAHTEKEAEQTSYFLWNPRRPYHMDFVFVPKVWTIDSVRIGTFAEYPDKGRSDHVPVVVSVVPNEPRAEISSAT